MLADHSATRIRIGNGLFERSENHKRWISGWDFRARLMLFDPAGTAGGLGFFVETRYLWTFGGRQLSPLYGQLIGPAVDDQKSWNYLSWSVGVVAPLALRIVSF